jgi:hypothetical protein
MAAGGDPFRRVRPGEAVRITATAWNALLDLLRTSGNPQGGGSTAPELPATVASLRKSGSLDPVLGEAVIFSLPNTYDGEPATTPLSTSMTFSTVEKRLWGEYRSYVSPMAADNSNASPDDPFAICLDPLRSRYAISGMAWVRVRQLRSWHRFARRCIALPTDGSTQLAAVRGCLDSCGWGPAEILGFAPVGFDPSAGQVLVSGRNNSFVSGQIRWALVRF